MTDRGRKALEFAQEEARRLQHEAIMPEHLLLGILKVGSGIAGEALARLRVDAEQLRREAEKRIPVGLTPADAATRLRYSLATKEVLESAFLEARVLGHNYIGTEHLILGLFGEDEGIPAKVLQAAGVTDEALRTAILDSLNSLAGEAIARTGADEVVVVGVRKQLFIDRKFIERSENVTLDVNPPTKAGPIELDFEPGGMVSIVEHDGQHYMYLRGEGGLAVAVSGDGLRWRRVESSAFGPGRELPLPGVDSGGVFMDPKESDHPFKGVFDIRQAEPWGADPLKVGDVAPTQGTQATARGGLHLFQSRDGFQWELVPGLPVPFLCDTQNQVLYDARLSSYVTYLRAFPTLGGPHNYKRCVARTEMADLYEMPWPHELNVRNKPEGDHDFPYIQDEMSIVMAADEKDPPEVDLYNPMVHQYPWAEDVYLAFPSMYRTWGYDGKNKSHGRDHRGLRSNDGLFETHLAISREGKTFYRYRVPYLPSGLIRDREGRDGELDCGHLCMALGMVRKGDELWQYYHGTRRTHMTAEDGVKYGLVGQGIFRVVQRLDGFVSADADHRGGELLTPPIVFHGNRLMLNAACHGLGEIRVELQDAEGSPLPGYGLGDSVSIVRNGTAQEVWWRGGPDVRAVREKPVRLRFKMSSAKLYGFQFVGG